MGHRRILWCAAGSTGNPDFVEPSMLFSCSDEDLSAVDKQHYSFRVIGVLTKSRSSNDFRHVTRFSWFRSPIIHSTPKAVFDVADSENNFEQSCSGVYHHHPLIVLARMDAVIPSAALESAFAGLDRDMMKYNAEVFSVVLGFTYAIFTLLYLLLLHGVDLKSGVIIHHVHGSKGFQRSMTSSDDSKSLLFDTPKRLGLRLQHRIPIYHGNRHRVKSKAESFK